VAPPKFSILLAIAASTLGTATARADDTPDYANLTDDELVALAEAAGEVIVVWDERPEKPFDRDTELRLTGDDLAALGVANLGDALALVPEVTVRAAGRGGQNLDIRGARKAAVRVLVDGVPLEDPYYGTFDLTTIPITDIEQIRVATSPSSPIDGPGGPGGVIEVHTRDAIGDRDVIGRAAGDTLPTAAAAATGRGNLSPAWGLRASLTGTLGDHAYAVPGGTVDDESHFGGGALRVEWRPAKQDRRRAVLDVAGFQRAFLVPPADEDLAVVTRVDSEVGARATAAYEDRLGQVQIAARAHGTTDHRIARYYDDASLSDETGLEDMTANRAGASFLANRPLARTMQLIGAAHLVTEDARVEDETAAATAGRSTIGELAGGWQYEAGIVRIDGAGGVAIPLGVGEHPWPEGKLSVGVSPVPAVTFTATVARKGRLPTLRERYRLDVGNTGLDPEMTSFAEMAVEIAPTAGVKVEASSWVRRQSGLITLDGPTRMLVNLGEVDFGGIDARAEVTPDRHVSLAAAWSFVDAQDATADEPLDNLPAHRLQGQVKLVPGGHVTALGRVSWSASRMDRGIELAPYTDVEAELTWAPTDRWLVSARGDDLLDSRWDLHAGIPSVGRTIMIAVQAELR
jgi:outer membrane cobalamin receptor